MWSLMGINDLPAAAEQLKPVVLFFFFSYGRSILKSPYCSYNTKRQRTHYWRLFAAPKRCELLLYNYCSTLR